MRDSDVEGRSALSWAVTLADHAGVASALLDAGALPDERDALGLTPLGRAVLMGFAGAANVIREREVGPGD